MANGTPSQVESNENPRVAAGILTVVEPGNLPGGRNLVFRALFPLGRMPQLHGRRGRTAATTGEDALPLRQITLDQCRRGEHNAEIAIYETHAFHAAMLRSMRFHIPW